MVAVGTWRYLTTTEARFVVTVDLRGHIPTHANMSDLYSVGSDVTNVGHRFGGLREDTN